MKNWFNKEKKHSDSEVIHTLLKGSRKEVASMHNYLLSITLSKVCHARKARAILNDKEMREVVFHEAYTIFIIKIKSDSFKPESKLSTFFTKIFLDKCVDMLRKINTDKYKANRPGELEIEERLRNLAPLSYDILNDLYTKTDMEIVRQTLEKMDNNCPEIIQLRLQGYSHAEIADILGLTAATVKTRNSQCRKKLIEKLKGKLF